jgi:hypothetical protein
MDKQHILDEIVRTAQENNGRPLGIKKFEDETGIALSDWYGRYWARWGDAVKEAGYQPNILQDSYDEDWMIEKLISLTRELGHFPVKGEMLLKTRTDKTFPNPATFDSRLRGKAGRVKKVLDYCRSKTGYEDVIQICEAITHVEVSAEKDNTDDDSEIGYVYLIKSGRYYKIGRSNSAGRREYELAIQLPEKAITEHVIKTDDPTGIEAYWHKRFSDRRKNGEWFALTAADVRAFKKRRFM